MKKSILIALFAAFLVVGCGKKCYPVADTQACHLLLQAYETAEGMSPGWYGRTAATLDTECGAFVPPKEGSV